ncbi:hypothetical protein KsCSTR_21720 [Candidatus Kuenenia stuttgartiensis]|uniref:Uncharacterized protein n=1 Tax=Kuenenia stuttgartiensis TaxID=174633 RepID=A0A6G7GQ41_KUEST|nr:hypothetical protein KsCSTR_21720 [Candidatus Kuenenia stuttgartiensis]
MKYGLRRNDVCLIMRSYIADAFKKTRIDKGLHKPDWMPIDLSPVL